MSEDRESDAKAAGRPPGGNSTSADRVRRRLDRGVAPLSDDLVLLRDVLEWARGQKLPVDLLPRLSLVIDTSCVLQELDHILRFKKPEARTALQEMVDCGIVRLFGPRYLDEEVRTKIPKFAQKRGLAVERLEKSWQAYQARIRLFVPPSAQDVVIRDKNDVAFLEAQKAIGADAVLTVDDDILESGSAALTPDVVHRPLRNFARQKSIALTIGVDTMGGGVIAGKAIVEVARFCAKRPWALLLGAGGGVALAYVHKRQVSEKGSSFWHTIRDFLVDGARELLTSFEKAKRAADAGWQEFSGALGDPAPRTLSQKVLSALLWHAQPMKEHEILDDVLADSPEISDRTEISAQIAALLRSDRRFRWNGDGWLPPLSFTSPPSAAPQLGPSVLGSIAQGVVRAPPVTAAPERLVLDVGSATAAVGVTSSRRRSPRSRASAQPPSRAARAVPTRLPATKQPKPKGIRRKSRKR